MRVHYLARAYLRLLWYVPVTSYRSYICMISVIKSKISKLIE